MVKRFWHIGIVFVSCLAPHRFVQAEEGIPDVELPAHLSLDDALHILTTKGIDLLVADAAVNTSEGDLTSASAIPNPTLSGGLYHSFFADHLYETNSGWFVGLGDNNAIEDILSGK